MPTALAIDAQGNLYVADGGAQRIRVVSPHGVVRTLAGGSHLSDDGLWGEPGNADGPAANARFNEPLGIAVGRDKTVYVADTKNHRVRRISLDGTVSTFAAGLDIPRGLAFDDGGNLYVADSTLGIRKIAPNGIVTSVPAPVEHPYGIAVFDHPLAIAVSDEHGIEAQIQGIWVRISSDATPGVETQGAHHIGVPYELARIGAHSIVYTDPTTSTIRYLDLESKNSAILEALRAARDRDPARRGDRVHKWGNAEGRATRWVRSARRAEPGRRRDTRAPREGVPRSRRRQLIDLVGQHVGGLNPADHRARTRCQS